MTATFFSLISLFISCFILLLGNGLMNVLLPVRMGLDGIGTDVIGMVQSLYFVGLVLGAIYSKNLIMRAGHIRMFAGCVSFGAATILMHALFDNIWVWGAMRMLLGFCNACAFTAMESWLSDATNKETRGKMLAVYNAVVLSALFFGQFFLNVADPANATLFIGAGVLLSLAVIPVVMSRLSGPPIEDVASMPITRLYRISPLGVVTCLVSGIIYSAVFNLLPIFAKDYGIVGFELSLYMGAAIAGAFLLQFPVGYLSDRFDRRTVLVMLLIISTIACVFVVTLAPMNLMWGVFLATGITSGIIACTYPISIAEAFDKLRQSEMVAAMGSMILAFSLGGVMGPFTFSILMDQFGNGALFYALGATQVGLVLFVLYRMRVREALPVEDQESFVMQGAAVPAAVDLDPRTEYVEPEQPLSAEAETVMGVANHDPVEAIKIAKAIAKSNPHSAVELAGAVAKAENLNVLNLYEAMKDIVPYQILEVTNAIVTTRPELAGELVAKLAEWYPEQVVSVAAEVGRALPESRVEMARIAAETAPESAMEVAEYYAQVLAEERENLRPADREDDTSEEDAVYIAAELWDVAPEQALDVAATFVDAVPETAASVAQEYLSRDLLAAAAEVDLDEQYKKGASLEELEQSYQQWAAYGRKADMEPEPPAPEIEPELAEPTAEEIEQGAVELVQRLSEVAPDQAVDVAVAVAEAEPEVAAAVASEVASNWGESGGEESADEAQDESVDTVATEPETATDEVSSEELQEAAVDLVQRLSEVAPEQAVDVAVAVVEAEPEVAAVVASEVASTWGETEEEVEQETSSDQTEQPSVSDDDSVASEEESEETYEAAVELVQRLSEVAPEQAVDVAVAVVEAEPDSAASVAAEVASTMSDVAESEEFGEEQADVPETMQDESEQIAASESTEEEASHEAAVELVQRLSEVSPDNTMDVAVAVVESIPEAASDVVDAISKGEEAKEEEWMMGLDEKPEDFDDQVDSERKPDES